MRGSWISEECGDEKTNLFLGTLHKTCLAGFMCLLIITILGGLFT